MLRPTIERAHCRAALCVQVAGIIESVCAVLIKPQEKKNNWMKVMKDKNHTRLRLRETVGDANSVLFFYRVT